MQKKSILGWAIWTAWTMCSNTCGHGIRMRERACRGQSNNCHGRNREEEQCDRGPCISLKDSGSIYDH